MPGKNIRVLGGKPAIEYTIIAARECGLFSRIVVSTDSPAIADLASKMGADVPFLREAALADDFTPVSEVTLDVLNRVDEDPGYTAICQLMANCPLRNADDIRNSYEQFVRSDANAQISVTEYGWLNPWWAAEMDESFHLTHLLPQGLGKRSQDLATTYCPTGAIWWAKCSVLRTEGSFHTRDKRGCPIPWQRAIDIDSEDDWKMAEVLLEMSRRDFV